MQRRVEVVLLDDDVPAAAPPPARPRKRARRDDDDADSPAAAVVDLCADDAPAGASGAGALCFAPHGVVDLTGGGSGEEQDSEDDVVITAVTGSGARSGAGSASRRARRALRAAADVVIVHPTAALSAPRARSAVLRLTTPLTLALGGLPSAVVHLKDVNRDRGFALMQHLTPTLAPNWRAFLGGGLLHSTMHQLALPGAVGDDGRRLRGIGRVVLRAAAEAVLAAGAGAAGERRDAADELLAPQRFLPISALAYSATNGTLHDHVDGTGRYLVLLSLGCTVNFLVDGRVVSFESGDALVFNGGRYHDVMHGVRNVQPGTCPACLPRELRDARVSLQLRQM